MGKLEIGNFRCLIWDIFIFMPPTLKYIGFGLSVRLLLQTGFEWLCLFTKLLYVAKWACVASQIAPFIKFCKYRVLRGVGQKNQIIINHLNIVHPYGHLGHGGPGLCDLYRIMWDKPHKSNCLFWGYGLQFEKVSRLIHCISTLLKQFYYTLVGLDATYLLPLNL